MYHLDRNVSIGLKYQMLFRANDEIWHFNNSHLEYQNFGKSSNAVFKDLGIFMNFIAPIY